MKKRTTRKFEKGPAQAVSRWAAEAERLYNQGQFNGALNLAGEGLAHTPDDPLLWNLCAASAHALGYLADAEQFWRTAILKQPDFAKAHYNLGILLFQQERWADAEAAFRKVVALAPNNAKALNYLGAVLMATPRRPEAVTHIRQALALDPKNANAYNNLGIIYGDLRQYDEALKNFSKAIAYDPASASAHSNRGYLHMEMGAYPEARRDLTAAIRADPNLAEAFFNLSLLETPGPDTPWLQPLEALYARRESLPPTPRCSLEFAMGKVQEGLGRYDAAFNAYRAGNELYFRAHPYNEAAEERWLEGVQARYTAEVVALGGEAGRDGEDSRVPVFIVGMPRSGTTLLEQILSSHPALHGAGELPLLPEMVRKVRAPGGNAPEWRALLPKLRMMGRDYLDEVWKRAPESAYISDKLPGNFRYLGLLHLMLPQAKIIHSMRDPIDTCVSCYSIRFKRGHEYSYDLGALGRYYNRYRQVMAHWRRVLPPGAILDVSYEGLIDDPEGEVRRMLEFVGLPWDPACLRFHENKRAVGTASVTQVRQQMYGSSRGRWRRFDAHLGPLVEVLSQGE